MLKKARRDQVNPIPLETVEPSPENAIEPYITGLEVNPNFLGFTHSQVAEFTGKKVSTISPYFSRGRITKGNGRAFQPNKKTMLWDEIPFPVDPE